MRRMWIFVVLLLIICVSFVYAQSDLISDISVRGLKNVSQKTVLSEISSKKGKLFSESTIREDIRALFEYGAFEDVQYDFNPSNGRLVFIVEERPYIERIDFKGNKEFSRGKLRSESVLKRKKYFSQMQLDESIEKINTLYKNRGYTDVQIEAYPALNSETNKLVLNFLITENNKVTIGGVDVEGAVAYKKRKVLGLIKKTRIKKVFNEQMYGADLTNLETFYKERGFMDYQLIASSISYNEDRTKIFVHITIDEGPKFKFGNISYWGNNVINDITMGKSMRIKSGKVYRLSLLNESLMAVYEAYSDKGYLEAQIEPEFERDLENGVVNITFQIEEGIEIFVGNIYIDGLESTAEKVIRREIRLKTGDPLSVGKFRQSMARIYNLGFIESIEPQQMRTRQRDVIDIGFNITEGKPGMVSAGIGYSSVDEFVGSIQFQHLNVFGLGQRVNALVEFGFGQSARRNYQVDWTEPYIFDQNMSLTLSGYQVERTRDYNRVPSAYKEMRRGGSVSVGPRFSDVIFLSVGYSYENVHLDDTNFPRSALYEQEDYNSFKIDTGISRDNISSLLTTLAYDTRDVYFDPSRGQRQSISVRYATDKLGGNTNFVKTTFRSSWYFPTFWRFVLGFNFTVARADGYANQDVPLYERYYIGGADTVRGYDYQQIGYPSGARIMGVANVEYKFPIVMEKRKTILQGVFFYDIGGSWEKFGTVNMDVGIEHDNLRSGVGFGIRFATPMFPLRLDWGYGLNHRRGDKLQKFYFSIGNIF